MVVYFYSFMCLFISKILWPNVKSVTSLQPICTAEFYMSHYTEPNGKITVNDELEKDMERNDCSTL
jgi:hypothetical protein